MRILLLAAALSFSAMVAATTSGSGSGILNNGTTGPFIPPPIKGSGLTTSTTGQTNPGPAGKAAGRSLLNFQNIKNPFENLGVLHNEAMDYVRKNTKIGAPASEVLKLVDRFFEIKKISRPYQTGEFMARGLRAFQLALIKAEDKAAFLHSNGHFSLAAARIYPQIESLCFGGLEIGDLSKLVKYEDEIQRNSKLTSNERDIMLFVSAICRYSVEYVARNYDITFKSGVGLPGPAPQRSDIGKDDVAGGISGAIGGGMAGAAAGGVGALPGAAIGGISGCVAASATSWLMSFW